MLFKTIIVAFSNLQLDLDSMLKILIELNLKAETKVVLSHVVDMEKSDLDREVDRPQSEMEKADLGELENQLRLYKEKLPYQTQVEIVMGEPTQEIVRLSNIYNADLIVIGNRGLKGINRIVQGSVSSQVVAEANCSVLVVKQG
ncbi:MAG: universal stress protein [Trichodesmium sp.]